MYNEDAVSKRIEAIHENGILRPLEPLDLQGHRRARLILSPIASAEGEWLGIACLQLCAAEADESISLEMVGRVLSKMPGPMMAGFVAGES